jgi:hypothetical protein
MDAKARDSGKKKLRDENQKVPLDTGLAVIGLADWRQNENDHK